MAGMPDEDIADPTDPRARVRPSADTFLPDGEYELKTLEPLGAEVRGLNLRIKPAEEVLEKLQHAMSISGFIVFRGQGILHGDEQVEISEYFGGRKINSTHGVHPKA